MVLRFARILFCACLLAPLLSGCDGGAPSAPLSSARVLDSDAFDEVETRTASAELPAEAAESSRPDVAEAVAQWREWRREKRYRRLEPHLEVSQRAVFIDTIVGVDLVLAANRDACQAIAEALGAYRTELWDLSSLGNELGIFSDEVSIVQIRGDADRATVTFQVGERLPLETAELRWTRDGWLYAPGAGPHELPGLLRDLARTLTEVAEMIRRDRPDAARINQEYRLRVFPRLLAAQRAGKSEASDSG